MTSPELSPHGSSHVRIGKKCRKSFRYNKSKKLCISKINSPSPVSNASYEPTGKRCRKTFRYHKPSGLCVYSDRPRINRELPLPFERQEELVSPDESGVFVSPANSENDEFYSPEESPVKVAPKKFEKLDRLKQMGVEL